MRSHCFWCLYILRERHQRLVRLRQRMVLLLVIMNGLLMGLIGLVAIRGWGG